MPGGGSLAPWWDVGPGVSVQASPNSSDTPHPRTSEGPAAPSQALAHPPCEPDAAPLGSHCAGTPCCIVVSIIYVCMHCRYQSGFWVCISVAAVHVGGGGCGGTCRLRCLHWSCHWTRGRAGVPTGLLQAQGGSPSVVPGLLVLLGLKRHSLGPVNTTMDSRPSGTCSPGADLPAAGSCRPPLVTVPGLGLSSPFFHRILFLLSVD